jgi:DNA-binding transcriptional ArsR family regulator
MPGHSHRFLDERLAKALSHRSRVRILQRLEETGEASPQALAQALGEPLGKISYHVRILRDLDCVELVRTETRRGALAHFYRATVGAWLDDEQWAGLSAGMRRETVSRTLSEIVEQAAAAGREGGFDGLVVAMRQRVRVARQVVVGWRGPAHPPDVAIAFRQDRYALQSLGPSPVFLARRGPS